MTRGAAPRPLQIGDVVSLKRCIAYRRERAETPQRAKIIGRDDELARGVIAVDPPLLGFRLWSERDVDLVRAAK